MSLQCESFCTLYNCKTFTLRTFHICSSHCWLEIMVTIVGSSHGSGRGSHCCRVRSTDIILNHLIEPMNVTNNITSNTV